MTSTNSTRKTISTSHYEDTEAPVWRPVRYHLKLGLMGWFVKETVVDTGNDRENDNKESGEEDQQDRTEDPDNDLQEAKNKLSHLKNPDIEESEQGLFSGIGILYSRLNKAVFNIFQIGTSPIILNATFSRSTLSQTFGGSMIDTFPKVKAYRLPSSLLGHCSTRFMCLNALYNAHCPQHPGAPGLYYALRDPGRWPYNQELVFVRYGANRWNFMGTYSIIKAQSLSAEEFQSLSPKVQETWFSNIWSHKWGNYTLAAIYLRKHQRQEPADSDVEDYAKNKAALIRRKVSSIDVSNAFMTGEEKINVWTMQCIGYSEDLKKMLVPKRKTAESGKTGRATKKRRI